MNEIITKGKKKFYKTWYGITIIILGFIILIGIMGVEEKETNPISSTATPTITEPAIDTEVSRSIEKELVKEEEKKVATSNDSQYKYYSVSSVVDGDTVKINMDGETITLRLIGMDTPETVDPRKPVQCFGKEASNKAKELLNGKKVRIEKDSTQGDLDKYGRTLAYIHREDGLFYNKYMIEQGYAHEYTYNTPYKYQNEFKDAQKQAQTNLVGLWSPNTCNGDTTSSTTTETTSTGKYYTSSATNATRYYPETCPAWQNLSKTNLKSFDSLEALLASYPSRTLSPSCQ